tara:strand:+ start:149 stop:598 length:450 start_codon:yes stop_codon:yes gene_type:complete
MTVYHYTHLKAGISILQDGFIEVPETSSNNISSAIWFTKQSKYLPSTLNENKSFDKKLKTVGCMRFVYNDVGELTTWIDFVNNLKLKKKDFEEVLNHLDKSESETSNWFCSLKNISLKELVSIEVFTDKWDWANDDNIQYAVRKAEALK